QQHQHVNLDRRGGYLCFHMHHSDKLYSNQSHCNQEEGNEIISMVSVLNTVGGSCCPSQIVIDSLGKQGRQVVDIKPVNQYGDKPDHRFTEYKDQNSCNYCKYAYL